MFCTIFCTDFHVVHAMISIMPTSAILLVSLSILPPENVQMVFDDKASYIFFGIFGLTY